MAKPIAPLLSFAASGTVAKTLTYARWKGRSYVKHSVAGVDPRTVAQLQVRDTFRTANGIYDNGPDLFIAVWRAFAAGQVLSAVNALVGRFIQDNLGRSDLLNITFSPGANGGLRSDGIAVSGQVEQVTLDFTNPGAPPGWVLESAIGAAIRDGDPTTLTQTIVIAGEDSIAQLQVVLTGLVGGETYIAGGWLRWTKPDGSVAYSPSLPAQSVVVGVAPYVANAVRFDGVNDFLTRDAALSGAADTKNGLISFWINFQGGDGAALKMFEGSPGQVELIRLPSNKWFHRFQSDGGLAAWNGTTANLFVAADGWRHYLLSFDASAGLRRLYIQDALQTVDGSVENDTPVDWESTDWGIGAIVGGAQKMDGDVADFYLSSEFLDLSVEANRRKFIDASLKPVSLGSDGSTPTGTKPLIFLSGPTDTWHVNKGSGGGLTEHGALTTAPTSPSD